MLFENTVVVNLEVMSSLVPALTYAMFLTMG